MNPPTHIETARLVLRKPVVADTPRIFEAYANDAEVTRYLTWRPHRTVADGEEPAAHRLAAWESGAYFCWVIMHKEDGGELIGMISIRPNAWRVNLGYVLGRKWWGRGYMTEAVRAVVDYALSESEVFRVWAVCDVANAASARVLEKAGMRREGILRRWEMHPNLSDEPRDSLCYARVK
ncbi:MAG TPA: GNAT family N-acetyltransferase [Pyrinomonadaceae bacterium]|jgi:RimJ/RimL family protein N-acetyltransferase|nr:GNAT family N-acetyltransferase [Pyrinomonadaceae bacterium]